MWVICWHFFIFRSSWRWYFCKLYQQRVEGNKQLGFSKMSFNLDLSDQAQVIIFSRKKKSPHPSVYFNNIIVSSTSVQKHLDVKLSYKHHLIFVLKNVNNTIVHFRKFQQILTRQSLITIYNLITIFIRPDLAYGDIVYDGAFNESFHNHIESIQYNWAILIIEVIRGTSSEKLFQGVG